MFLLSLEFERKRKKARERAGAASAVPSGYRTGKTTRHSVRSLVRLRLLLLCVTLIASCCGFAGTSEALQLAAEAGDVAALETLLRQDADVNSLMPDGSSALHWAALYDQQNAVAFLLKNNAAVDTLNRNGVSPLYLAALNGSAEVTTQLLAAGANANASLPNGETLLMTAAKTGSVPVLQALLAHGALVDTPDPGYQQTALMIASRENHPQAVRLLISLGADVNAHTRVGPVRVHIPPCKGTGCGSEGVGINRSGVPARGERYEQPGSMNSLLYAAREGNTEVARALLNAGADIETTEANGISPLLMAILNNQLEVASLLLAYAANVNVEDFWGRTPLFAAVDYRNLDLNSSNEDSPVTNHVDRKALYDIIVQLLEAGADVNARTREWPPEKKWLYALNDVSWVDMTGMTSFIRAAESADVQVMRLLLQYAANPDITTYEGTTALMAAAGVNWTVAQTYTESDASALEAVKLCIALGADVNASNSMQVTALLGAANRGFNDMIRLLVENGARLDVHDAAGRTALRWAQGVFLAAVGAQHKPETIALLKELMDAQGLAYD